MNAHGATRSVGFGNFVVGPDTDITRETDLRGGEVLTAVLLPPLPAGARSVFLKQGEKSFDWSIADVAVVLDRAPDGRCRRASVVLGAAAPIPWRAPQAEAALAGQTIDATVAHAAGQAAIAGAVAAAARTPTSCRLLAALVRRAVLQAAAATNQEIVR